MTSVRARLNLFVVMSGHLLLMACGRPALSASEISSISAPDTTATSLISAKHKGCISHHIHEAIALNSERLPLYAAASDGRSVAISQALLNLEKLVLATLPLIEKPAEKYQERGIPLFCLDVVPMSDTPAFIERVETSEDSYVAFDGLSLSLALARSVVTKNDSQLEYQLGEALAVLAENKRFNCLTRHLVESILRSVRLTPMYRQMSSEAGLRDPAYLLRILINTQISALGLASHLDAQAAGLNAEGIPVICNDLPHIETDLEKVLADKQQ